MKGFKLCPNGHYYEDGLASCPYCPKTEAVIPTEPVTSALNKTKIVAPHTPEAPQVVNRKLVGWLVSFTMDPNGKDFKLYEGRNTIGSDPSCDIVISGDPAVSSKHLTILYRMSVFKFKDELSTNGTFIDDLPQDEGELQDGHVVKVGRTIFTFKAI